jgi:hypothetical protein
MWFNQLYRDDFPIPNIYQNLLHSLQGTQGIRACFYKDFALFKQIVIRNLISKYLIDSKTVKEMRTSIASLLRNEDKICVTMS